MIIVLLFFLARHHVCAEDLKESPGHRAGRKGWDIRRRTYENNKIQTSSMINSIGQSDELKCRYYVKSNVSRPFWMFMCINT